MDNLYKSRLVNKPLFDGKYVFELMDTHGLPLEIVNEKLRELDTGFNVITFIESAIESKNYTYQTIKNRLVQAMVFDVELREEFTHIIDSWWRWKTKTRK